MHTHMKVIWSRERSEAGLGDGIDAAASQDLPAAAGRSDDETVTHSLQSAALPPSYSQSGFGLWPEELWENKFVVLSQHIYDSFLQQPQETNIGRSFCCITSNLKFSVIQQALCYVHGFCGSEPTWDTARMACVHSTMSGPFGKTWVAVGQKSSGGCFVLNYF